jgi:hypothetical protein
MTCQECELLLAGGEADASVEDHLRECADCRALQEELQANALALGAFRDEELPRLAPPRRIPRPVPAFPWMSAVAAAMVLAVILPGIWQATRPVPPSPVKAKMPQEVTVTAEPPAKAETLTVKMLTPDPSVVIYWLIDSKEGD